MMKVKIYSTQYCPFCIRAKQLAESKGLDLEVVDVTQDDETRSKIADETGWQTVPMIFLDGEFVGGYQEFASLDAAGKLG